MQNVFTTISESNFWKGTESMSGTGSDSANTIALKQQLPILIREYNVKSMLDVPCGDFNWMKDVALPLVKYIGADIVQEIVELNEKRYGNKVDRLFVALDITSETLPCVDMIFCRDCLVHLPLEYVRMAIVRIKASGSRLLLTTTFPNTEVNEEIEVGNWRMINLEKYPFNFPKPLELIDEQYVGEDGKYRDKSLGLWLVNDLPN